MEPEIEIKITQCSTKLIQGMGAGVTVYNVRSKFVSQKSR